MKKLLFVLLLIPISLIGQVNISNNDMRIDADGKTIVDSTLTIGSSTTTNVTIDATEGIRLNGGSTVWNDILVPLTSTKLGSNSKPDFNQDSVWYEFPQNDTTEILYTTVQMGHDWVEGSTIYPHIHWVQKANEAINYRMQYKWADVGETTNESQWQILDMGTQELTYTSGALHQITSNASGIDGTGHTLSSILRVKLYRKDNTYTGDAHTLQFDIHYEIDALGSKDQYIK